MIKSKKDNYKFWHSPLALGILFLILVFFCYKIIDLISIKRETSYKKNLVLEQIDELKERESLLSENISKLKTEEGREEVIRDKYQVAKEGEKMVIIVDQENKDISIPKEEKVRHGFFEWFKTVFER